MRIRPGRHFRSVFAARRAFAIAIGVLGGFCARGASAQVLLPPPAQPAPAPPEIPLIKVPLAEACILKLTDGRLVFTTKLPYTGVSARPVEVTGLPGSTELSSRPTRLFLKNEHVRADGAHVWVEIERRRSYFRYQRTVRQGDVDRVITFTQSYADDDSVRLPAGRVKLIVAVDGELVEDVSAADFLALRREHPRAFYRDMVPSLRLLQADPLMSVDPWEARQVLAQRVPPEAVPELVRSLVADLGHKSFKVREGAVRKLTGLGQAGTEELKKIDPASLSPEQSLAVDVLLKKHAPLTDTEADALAANLDFLLDCLYCEEQDVTAAAIGRLEKLSGGKVRLDLTVPIDERATQIEALRAKLTAGDPSTKPATKPAP